MSIFYAEQIFSTKFPPQEVLLTDYNNFALKWEKLHRLCWSINICHIKAAPEHHQGKPNPLAPLPEKAGKSVQSVFYI